MLFESEKTLFFSWERRRMIDKTRKSMFKKNSEPELLIIKIRSDRNSDPGPKSVTLRIVFQNKFRIVTT